MIKLIFSLLFTVSSLTILMAQDNSGKVLMTIDGNKITRGEFERIYTKNNQQPAFDSTSLKEYNELFINFKLKVMEAEALGMDTLISFISELSGYRKQLEKPYFTEESADESLMQEAYERMKWNVRASHILIMSGEDALPADTLAAWNEINRIRKLALKGENFGQLAVKYSQDQSAKQNSGDLGYFGAFAMVYPFETGAFNTPVGQISEIVRTRFGYHIIKVVDKKPDQGQVRTAHIMRTVPKNSGAGKDSSERILIHAVYDSLMMGANFEEMARRYSDDRGSSQKGGELPVFGVRQMVLEFEKAAFDLKEVGQISKPIKTSYGWHIIKLLEFKPLGTYESLKPTIKNKVSKDVRALKGQQMVLDRLKKEYKVTVNRKELEPFYTVIDSTIYEGKWDSKKAKGLNKLLFTIADTNRYYQNFFAMYISNDGIRRANKPLRVVTDEEFEKYLDYSVTLFEKRQLEKKYPDFKNLMQEYHDGILLFNLTDKMVWSKAVQDTAGLEAFYEANKNNYLWGERADASIYTFDKKEWEAKIKKLALNTGKKKLDVQKELSTFMSKVKDTALTVTATRSKYSKGDNQWVDGLTWTAGSVNMTENNGSFVLVYINAPIAPEPKKLNEAKGLITADYQNYLEKNWLASLRNKYKVVINQEVFNEMIK